MGITAVTDNRQARRSDLTDLRRYIRHLDDIEGWLLPEAAALMTAVSRIQRDWDVTGDLFEIGVYRGKSAVLLALLADPEYERLKVCDVFADQTSNPSKSGRGERAAFEKLLHEWVESDCDFLDVYQFPSGELSVEDTGHRCRIFHVDGGHHAEEALNDLMTADQALLNAGMVVVDDYFNEAWPGVSEGVMRFLLLRPHALVPVAHGFNKMLLCRPHRRDHWREALKRRLDLEVLEDDQIEAVEHRFVGGPCLFYRPVGG